jgi:periplasmic divalent cation tolerance protein
MAFIILYVIFPNMDEAKKVSNYLLEKKLIACANFFPMQSSYLWKNKIKNSNEVVTILKTIKENYKLVEGEIKKLHSYNVPCILKLDASANGEYEKWLNFESR